MVGIGRTRGGTINYIMNAPGYAIQYAFTIFFAASIVKATCVSAQLSAVDRHETVREDLQTADGGTRKKINLRQDSNPHNCN